MGMCILRNAHRKRKRRSLKRNNQQIDAISKRSIHDRPLVIKTKARIGNFKGDTIVDAKYSGYIVTLVDRKTKYLLDRKVDNKKSLCVSEAIKDLFADINTIQSVTFDNGSEVLEFKNMEEHLNCKVYFTDTSSEVFKE